MVYFLDAGVNLLLNMAGLTGLTDPHQILIAVVLASAAVLFMRSAHQALGGLLELLGRCGRVGTPRDSMT